MNDYSFDDPFILQASIVEADDVNQEIALLRLQGINASRRIVKMRLSQHSELLFQGDPTAIASPIVQTTLPPQQVIEMLVSWAIQQSDDISRAILDFLEEPTEDDLKQVIHRLQKAGLTSKPEKRAKKGSLSEVLTTYIAQKPRSREELYDYARAVHRAERPEAAVRQYLRRSIKEQMLSLGEDNLYRLATTTKEG